MRPANVLGIVVLSAALSTIFMMPGARAEEGMTLAALRMAHQREARAERCYHAYATRAAQEGCPMAATLFTALAQGEATHVRNFAFALERFGVTPVPSTDTTVVQTTAENLWSALAVEVFERREAYKRFMDYARAECLYDALAAMRYARDAELTHARAIAYALMDQDQMRLDHTYFVCPACGGVRSAFALGNCDCGTHGKQFVAVKSAEVATPVEPTLANR